MKMISKIAHKINDKHGIRVLEELEYDCVEMRQRRGAMGAAFMILGNPKEVQLDLDDRRTAFVFAVGYTVSFALARIGIK